MFRKLVSRMFPVSLSRGLEMVNRLKSRGARKPHWYGKPVMDLVRVIGDKNVDEVTKEDLRFWYDNLRSRLHERKGKTLSPYTVDSYARAVRSYFNLLIDMGHLDKSPWDLRLPTLPKTSKNAISDDDVTRMLKVASRNTRDHALLLILRDSGGRIGELVSMTVGNTHMERCYYNDGSRIIVLRDKELPPMGEAVFWRGRSLVMSEKNNQNRWILFKHDACLALRAHLETRLDGSPPAIWLTSEEKALTTSGLYQILQRIGRKVGAKIDNPHAFRHRLAKKLKEARVDPEIIARFMGHKNVATYQAIYGTTEDSELMDYHSKFVEW